MHTNLRRATLQAFVVFIYRTLSTLALDNFVDIQMGSSSLLDGQNVLSGPMSRSDLHDCVAEDELRRFDFFTLGSWPFPIH